MVIENPYAPVEVLNLPEFDENGLQVFIKREDLSHPFISGNKWRKLKYHLLDAHEQQKKQLVTFGGPYSNHLLATAAAAAKYKFESVGFVRGEAVSNPVLTLCAWFGMQLHFVSRSAYTDRLGLFDSHYPTDEAYFIDEGGAGPLGEKGAGELIADLVEPYDHIICSVGTGSTFKALVDAVEDRKMNTEVTGISVLKGVNYPSTWLERYPQSGHRIRDEFHQGGYAKITPVLTKFIQSFASQTGILLDQVYEGKMMMALSGMALAGEFRPGSRILTLHNGGLSGMLSLISKENG